MPSPTTSLKFIGTISLGLLTGVSYNLSTLTLPSLQLLPSATAAARTLRSLQISSTRHILSLASVSSLSLITAYWLAPLSGKHPYLLWVALVSFAGGQGVEGWYNGVTRFPKIVRERGSRSGRSAKRPEKSPNGQSSGDEWDLLSDGEAVNGESVESEMSRERWVQGLRTGIAGLGFGMAVIGLWGDGV